MTLARNIAFWPRVMTVGDEPRRLWPPLGAQRRALDGAGSAATHPAVQRIERVEEPRCAGCAAGGRVTRR